MSSLKTSFAAATVPYQPFDRLLTWLLIFLFLEITDTKEEKRRKEVERERLRIQVKDEALRRKKRGQLVLSRNCGHI